MTATTPRTTGSPRSDTAPIPTDDAPHGMFASLHLRNYRLYFFGMMLSNVGLWMFRVAQDWLVLTQLTQNSSLALGTITGLQFLPILLFSAYGGVLADRFDQRKLLMLTQTAAGLVALVQAVLVFTGTVQLWHVYVLALLGGVVASLDNPARQAFVSEMVPESYIVNAVGLNSTTFNASRLLGPGLAGFMIAAWGVGPAILFNAVSYAATLIALAMMDPSELRRSTKKRGDGSLREGLAYVRRRPDILLILFIMFMFGTFALNFQVTNALMATQVFRVGPEQYGLMGTLMGVGTFAGALMAASRKRPRMGVLIGALGVFTLGMLALTAAPGYLFYLGALVLVGLTSQTIMTSANATVQLSTDPVVRGRVMALYMMVMMGGTPIGAPLVGWVGAQFGARATLLVGALATGIATVVAAWVIIRSRRDNSVGGTGGTAVAARVDEPAGRDTMAA